MASKLGNLESAEATEYLTAILNGYQMEAEEATSVVDRLIAVDNIAATSFSELARAMQYSAAVANETGVSFNNLVGYIATVSSTTRLAPEMIGQAFKTIMTRFTNVKSGATLEDGMSLNNVEKVLGGVGIALRDATDSFRPLEDVIHDVAMKWGDLNEVQRAQLSTAIAGTRQVTIFNALMQNYGDTLGYVETQENAAGLASERYAIYLESVEAAQNRLTASWEKMWQETIESGAITWFLDLASAILDVISAGGGLMPVFTTIIGFMIALKQEQILTMFSSLVPIFKNVAQAIMGMIVPLNTVKFSLDGVKVAAVSTATATQASFGLIGLAIAGVSLLLMAFHAQSEQASRDAERLSQEVSQLYVEIGRLQSDKGKLFELGSEYAELKKLDDASKLTTEQMKRFVAVQNEIHQIVPQVSGSYDEQGNFIIENATNLGTLLELKREEIRVNEELLSQKLNEQILAQAEAYRQQKEEYSNLLKMQEGGDRARYGEGQVSDSVIDKQRVEMEDSLTQIKIGFSSLSSEQQKIQLELLRNSGEFGQELASQLEELVEKQISMSDRVKDDITEVRKEYTTLIEDLSLASDKMSILSDTISKSESGDFGAEDLEKLAEIYPEYLDALSIENDELTVNTDLLKKYALEQANAAIETARANGATDEQIALLQQQSAEFQKAIPFSKDFVETFDALLSSTSENLTGKAKEDFDIFAESIRNTNQQFKEGQLDAIEYFNILEEQLSSVDFASMFGENQQAAQTFFTGMSTNVAQSLYQMTSEFDAGKIGLVEYMDRMRELGDLFQVIGDIVITSGEALGMTSEQISGITGSLDGVISSISELSGMYDLVNMSIAGMSQGLEFNSEAYINWANMVSQAMVAVGGQWYTASGQALNSAQDIFSYATAASGNMNVLMNQIVGRVNQLIAKATSSIAGFLREIAGAISSFEGTISITPRQTGEVSFSANVLGVDMPFSIPSGEIDFSANFSSAASAIDSMASGIEDWGASSPINLDDFINPGGLGATSDAVGNLAGGLGNAGGAAGGLASQLDNATNSADELKKALEEAKKAAIDNIKAQIKAYKNLIDTRKRLLDSMEKEREYQDDVSDKNAEILKVENELATLQFDDSEEAQARRLQLEEELRTLQDDLEDIQFERSVDVQQEALDEEYRLFEDRMEAAIRQIEAIQANNVNSFASQLSAILAGLSSGGNQSQSFAPPAFHDGGVVGDFSMNSNEVFAKLMNGEVVVTPSQMDSFMKTKIPQIASYSSDSPSSFEINMPINVAGNLDKSVLPDLEKMSNALLEKINKAMMGRGYNRRADMYQI